MNNQNIEYLKKYLPKDKLEEGLSKLEKGISPQYIVGNVNFYGNIIKVDKRVLIPIFETELLVEKTINYIKRMFNAKVNILEICTGSGCIAITLKKEINSEITAIDISKEALEVALDNAKENNVDINFIESNLFSNIENKYDVIIMDPPSYGRGANGEVWDLDKDLNNLVSLCSELLSDKPILFLINTYSGLSPETLKNILELNINCKFKGKITCGEIGLKCTSNDLLLPCGIYGRWESD